MTVHELISDVEIAESYPLMAELRVHLEPSRFVAAVRLQQVAGHHLFGGRVGDALVALAGVRRTQTLARGEHLFVDDLVVSENCKGRGHGRALMQWLGRWAAAQGLTDVYLDSRDTAEGFYRSLGFVAQRSLPFRVEIAKLLANSGSEKPV